MSSLQTTTLAEFRSTATRVACAQYDDSLYIDMMNNGWHCLTISNSSWLVAPGRQGIAEAVLHVWRINDGAVEDVSTEYQAALAVAERMKLAHSPDALAWAVTQTLAEQRPGVCHLQSYCDVWPMLGEHMTPEADLQTAYDLLYGVLANAL